MGLVFYLGGKDDIFFYLCSYFWYSIYLDCLYIFNLVFEVFIWLVYKKVK